MTESKSDEPLLDLIRLSMIPGVGPQTTQALLEHFQTPGRVLAASRSQLREVPNVGPKLAEKIAMARQECDAEAELALCRRLDVHVIARDDPKYPPALQNIPDPPGLLYCKGQLEPRDQLAIAIVGSRHCTPYGMRIAERLASGLSRIGFTIVSGLARDRCVGPPGGDQGRGAQHRRDGQRPGLGLSSRARGSGTRPRGGRRPVERDADAASPARRPVHPAQPDHLGHQPRRRRGRGRAAQRLALDGQARGRAESRSLRRTRAGRQPRQPRLPSPDPRRRPVGRDGRRYPGRARPAGPGGADGPGRAAGPTPGGALA